MQRIAVLRTRDDPAGTFWGMLALHSVELVHSRMRQKLPPAPQHIRVVAEFLERSSTARI